MKCHANGTVVFGYCEFQSYVFSFCVSLSFTCQSDDFFWIIYLFIYSMNELTIVEVVLQWNVYDVSNEICGR
jgi:hypothetical protein